MRQIHKLTLAALFCISPTVALAQTSCTAPDALTVPASFNDLADAEATEVTVEAWLMASGQYQKCLSEERTALGESITPAEDAELSTLKQTAKSDAQGVAEAFNAAVVALHSNH